MPPLRNPAPAAVPVVTTILTTPERARVDAAGVGSYRAVHRETIEDVVRDLRDNRATGVLVSAARYDLLGRPAMASMVREFPRIPAAALLSSVERNTPKAMLLLGQSGIRQIVDVREPTGWRELRQMLLAARGDGIQRKATAALTTDLAGAPEDCLRFFESLFTLPPNVSTVRALGRAHGVLPSTLMSRFFRADLPAPKRYLAMARLVRAAHLFENAGFSIANVSNHMDYSSPQSFGRHVRALMGITALEFRAAYDGEGMLLHFRQRLVLPHLHALRRLRPLTTVLGWTASASAAH